MNSLKKLFRSYCIVFPIAFTTFFENKPSGAQRTKHNLTYVTLNRQTHDSMTTSPRQQIANTVESRLYVQVGTQNLDVELRGKYM